jgi:hypothetical protein
MDLRRSDRYGASLICDLRQVRSRSARLYHGSLSQRSPDSGFQAREGIRWDMPGSSRVAGVPGIPNPRDIPSHSHEPGFLPENPRLAVGFPVPGCASRDSDRPAGLAADAAGSRIGGCRGGPTQHWHLRGADARQPPQQHWRMPRLPTDAALAAACGDAQHCPAPRQLPMLRWPTRRLTQTRGR